jgi:hypothetical protein
MKPRRFALFACGMFSCIVFSAQAEARRWEALYAFGDSYTDSGAGYIDGNGPTAMVYLAGSLGIPFTYAGDPQESGKSLNFAVSGAQTGKADGRRMRPATSACGFDEALLGRGMENQVLDFRRRIESGAIRFDPERTLFFVAGGINDGALPTQTSVKNLENELQWLYTAGGRYFLLALLPTKIPLLSKVGVRLNSAFQMIPDAMRARVPGALFGEDPAPCSAPETYFYYHEGHPSTAVQRIVAERMKHEIEELFPQ